MATLAELQARRDALAAQLATGVSSAAFNGRKVDYRSTDEMQRTLAQLDAQIAAAQGRKPMRRYYTAGDKGL